MRVFVLLLAVLLFTSVAYAKKCMRFDDFGRRVEYACEETEEAVTESTEVTVSYEVEDVEENGAVVKRRIVPETVCADYAAESDNHQTCLDLARENFRKKCTDVRDRYAIASFRTPAMRMERDMFCVAADIFDPPQ